MAEDPQVAGPEKLREGDLEDVEMQDAAATELAELPEMFKKQLCVNSSRDDVETDMDDLRTSSRNSPAPTHFAYEPAISNRLVRRPRPVTLPRAVGGAIEEQVTYEETDANANLTRRQTFSRVIHPISFWDKHEHFRLWVRATVSSLILVLSVVMLWSIWRELRADVGIMVAEESSEGYYAAQYAQRMYEQNLCDAGPPVDLIQRCSELDKIRHKDYAAVPNLVGFAKMVRAGISTLFKNSDWRVVGLILIPLILIKLIRIC